MNERMKVPGSGRRIGLRAVLLVSLLTIVAGVALSAAALQERPTFPHARHEGLFPLCTGCHEGIPSSQQARFYPSADVCARCHDGQEEVEVAWRGPEERVSNLRFDHATHGERLERMDGPAPRCESCHSLAGRDRMAVSTDIQLGTCWTCHEATDHQTDADCATCHVPLAETKLSRAAIEAIPQPTDHEDDDFLAGGHGSLVRDNSARCATCHTSDRCVACHVDAGRPEIARLPAAPEGMQLPPATAHYSRPASHGEEGWLSGHGDRAGNDACATCHTSNDCMACHVRPVPAPVAALPYRSDVVAPGVGVEAHAPESHDNFFFINAHGTLAGSDQSSCSTCHVESFCVGCHEGPSDGGYHPANFVARHAADAFGRDAECANCHNTQVFCRECHEQTGLVGSGRLGPGYHEGQTVWLLRHGQAARQNLESCASCHKQRDCTQCHGVLGAFKVNPHPPDFDAQRAWERSSRTCFACHIGNPLTGSAP